MNYISRKIGLCICAVQLIASAVFFCSAVAYEFYCRQKYVTIIGLVLLLFLYAWYPRSFFLKRGNCGKSNQYFIKHWADFRILLYF